GAAGAACAETLRREGFSGRITMLTADEEPPYDRPMLSKGLLSGDAPAKYLPLRPSSFYEKLGITLRTKSPVSAVDPGARRVTIDGGDAVEADLILLATGGVPRTLTIPGRELDNVFTLRTHADASAIIAACEDAGKAVILGGSFIGMEVAAQLRQRGLDVTVVEPQPQPMAAALGIDVGAWIRSVHEEQGVTFRMGHTPTEIRGDGSVRSVQIDDGSELDADLVVMGVGVEPRVDYLAGSGLVGGDTATGVRVDEHLATSADGVYAAGDIAVFPRDDREYRVEHWVHAQEQGRHVARAMLGSSEPYRTVPFFWSRQYKTGIKYAGYPEQFDHVQFDGVAGNGEFIAGYFVGDRLVGIAAMGKANKFVKLSEMLEHGREVNRERFLGVRDTADE
ncbi:MAG: NAD(P)/FAD-dependent oxidoreductase, partial [Spirochaetota bacterium]